VSSESPLMVRERVGGSSRPATCNDCDWCGHARESFYVDESAEVFPRFDGLEERVYFACCISSIIHFENGSKARALCSFNARDQAFLTGSCKNYPTPQQRDMLRSELSRFY